MKVRAIVERWKTYRRTKKPFTERHPRIHAFWNRSAVRRARRITKRLGQAVILFHILTQAGYWTNQAHHQLRPSILRQQFEQQYGVKLRGWKSSIEEDGSLMSNYAEVFDAEYHIRPFKLGQLTVEAKEYWKKDLIDQFSFLLTSGHAGYYTPYLGRINVNHGERRYTLIHEIKHHMTYDVLKSNPKFKQEWEEISADEKGNSYYRNSIEQVASRFRGINFLVRQKPNYIERGFVSEYAQMNFYEDVAELCETMQDSANIREKNEWFFGKTPNRRIRQKVELAIRYGLLPPEIMERIRLTVLNLDAADPHEATREKVDTYLRESALFLKHFPNSIYSGEMHANRGDFLKMKKIRNEAEREYFACLEAPHKDMMSYLSALNGLMELYWDVPEKRKIFDQAYNQEYWRRFKLGDPLLPKIGINDWLEQQGIRFPRRN